MAVDRMAISIDIAKFKLNFNKIGKKIKKVKEGKIISNVLFVRSDTCLISFVSQ